MTIRALKNLNKTLWSDTEQSFKPTDELSMDKCLEAAQAVLDVAADEVAGDTRAVDTIVNIGLNMHRLRKDHPQLLRDCIPYEEAAATLLEAEKPAPGRTGRAAVATWVTRKSVAATLVGLGMRIKAIGRAAMIRGYVRLVTMPRWLKVSLASLTATTFLGTGWQIAAHLTREETTTSTIPPWLPPLPTTTESPKKKDDGECYMDEFGNLVPGGKCEGRRRREAEPVAQADAVECHDERCWI